MFEWSNFTLAGNGLCMASSRFKAQAIDLRK